jgi:hypothetical protein
MSGYGPADVYVENHAHPKIYLFYFIPPFKIGQLPEYFKEFPTYDPELDPKYVRIMNLVPKNWSSVLQKFPQTLLKVPGIFNFFNFFWCTVHLVLVMILFF